MRDLLAPGGCNGDGTVGGLPAAPCDPVPAIAYSYDINGNWVEDFAPGGGGNAVVIGIGDLSAVDPTPADGSWSVELGFAIQIGGPVSSPPLGNQVPTAWQAAGTSVGAPNFVLPLNEVPIATGTPFWMRNLITDENGCVATWLLWLPEGLPADWTSDLHGWLKVNDGSWVEFTLPGSSEVPVLIDSVVSSVGVCPPAAQSVAVKPCGDFPVQIDTTGGPVPVFLSGEAPEFPNALRIVGQVADDQGDDVKVTLDGELVGIEGEVAVTGPEGGPVTVVGNGEGGEVTVAGSVTVEPGADPLPVTLPAAVESAMNAVGVTSNDQADGYQTVDLPAGALAVMASAVGGDPADAGAVAFLTFGGHQFGLPRDSNGNWQALALPAMPAGFTYPAVSIVVRGGTNFVQGGLVGFYAP